jgi:hypothetical protein
MDDQPTLDYITPYPRHTRWTACTPERDGTLPKYVKHTRLACDQQHRENWLMAYLSAAYPNTIRN